MKNLYTAATAGILAAMLTLSSCSTTNSDPDPTPSQEAPTAEATSEPSETAETPTPEETQVGERDAIASFEGETAGIRGDVDLAECTLKAGAAKAVGTVTNSAPEDRDISVTIIWMQPKGNSSLARKTFSREAVKAGESVEFTIETELPEDARQCVVNARAGTFAK
ncbi:MAG: hypothetical protein Q4P36_01375 [Bowdeniella nasicola]|nr:hypothetical protein [Bowdeniella nasicola]